MISVPAEIEPRTDKSCSGSVSLPINEAFLPHTTVTMFSPPFHAAEGRTVSINLTAEMADPQSNPALGTVGVSVHQCCDLLDEVQMAQMIGHIGPPGAPEVITRAVTLRDECTLTTHEGSDCVYYLRLRISSSTEQVRLSYSVS
ncbi:conserved hypothetical protein [Frankia sp. Hr75.2]|nr:conserved hypothetical protein [Frankia sp. Hr75.2]